MVAITDSVSPDMALCYARKEPVASMTRGNCFGAPRGERSGPITSAPFRIYACPASFVATLLAFGFPRPTDEIAKLILATCICAVPKGSPHE